MRADCPKAKKEASVMCGYTTLSHVPIVDVFVYKARSCASRLSRARTSSTSM